MFQSRKKATAFVRTTVIMAIPPQLEPRKARKNPTTKSAIELISERKLVLFLVAVPALNNFSQLIGIDREIATQQAGNLVHVTAP